MVRSDAEGGGIKMEVGAEFAGRQFFDVMGKCTEPVTIDADGVGSFFTDGRSVSVWAPREAFEDLVINE